MAIFTTHDPPESDDLNYMDDLEPDYAFDLLQLWTEAVSTTYVTGLAWDDRAYCTAVQSLMFYLVTGAAPKDKPFSKQDFGIVMNFYEMCPDYIQAMIVQFIAEWKADIYKDPDSKQLVNHAY